MSGPRLRQGFLGEISAVENAVGPVAVRFFKRLQARVLEAEASLENLRNDNIARIGATASITVRKDGASVDVGTRPRLNFITGSGTTLSVTDDSANDEIDIAIAGVTPTLQAVTDVGATTTNEVVFNGGIDLGTDGDIDSNVADAVDACPYDLKPSITYTSEYNRYLFRVRNGDDYMPMVIASDGTITFNQSSGASGLISAQPTAILNATTAITDTGLAGSARFVPSSIAGAGVTLWTGKELSTFGGIFAARSGNDATNVRVFGGVFYNAIFNQARASTQVYAGLFNAFISASATGSSTTSEAGGILIDQPIGVTSIATGVITDFSQIKIKTAHTAADPSITNLYGIRIEEMTKGGTINNGIFLENATSGRKLIALRDQNSWIGSNAASQMDIVSTTLNLTVGANVEWALTAATSTLRDAHNIVVGSSTGTKIGTATTQKLGFWNVAPVVQPGPFTQTYSTASHTHANLTAATLTDSSGGTANTTVQALSDPADTPADADTLRDDLVANLIPQLRNNFADLTAQVNALLTDLTNLKQVVNAIIDDGQLIGTWS